MHNASFSLKNITKIEGHANLDLVVKNGKVESVKFKVTESERFFEEIVKGKHFSHLPFLVSRICGLCSSSHLTAGVKAVENAFNVPVSGQNQKLRELMYYGEIIKSHALHLYFLALPDYLGLGSVLDFGKKHHHFLHEGMDLKKAGTDLLNAVSGRAYQSISCQAGGFARLPGPKKLEECRKQLIKAGKIAANAVNLFSGFKGDFDFPTTFIALSDKKYSFISGDIVSSANKTIKPEDFLKHVKEVVVPYSNAEAAEFEGKHFMVGALPRINLNQKKLHSKAKKLIKSNKLFFPSNLVFANNVAQAIELVHCIESAVDLIDSLKPRKESLPEIKPKQASGVGVVEAPRGTLYHQFDFNSNGDIVSGRIIVPTNQNIKIIEECLKDFVPSRLHLRKPLIELEMEKLIRSFDPCISCATHFLKVNWK